MSSVASTSLSSPTLAGFRCRLFIHTRRQCESGRVRLPQASPFNVAGQYNGAGTSATTCGGGIFRGRARGTPQAAQYTRDAFLLAALPATASPGRVPGKTSCRLYDAPRTSLFKLAINWPFGQRRRTTPPCLRTSHRNVITHSLATFYPYMPQVVASSNPSLIVIAPSSGHPNCLRGVKCVRARAAGACAGTRHCPLSDTDTQSVFRKSAF